MLNLMLDDEIKITEVCSHASQQMHAEGDSIQLDMWQTDHEAHTDRARCSGKEHPVFLLK